MCERLGEGLRRGCLDFLIPFNERHLNIIGKHGRLITIGGAHTPHSVRASPKGNQESVPASGHRHKLPAGYRVAKRPVLCSLHHEYW